MRLRDTTTLACQMDARFKACLSLDGQMPPSAAFPENPDGKWFTQPFFFSKWITTAVG
jgi:hypothetical protein